MPCPSCSSPFAYQTRPWSSCGRVTSPTWGRLLFPSGRSMYDTAGRYVPTTASAPRATATAYRTCTYSPLQSSTRSLHQCSQGTNGEFERPNGRIVGRSRSQGTYSRAVLRIGRGHWLADASDQLRPTESQEPGSRFFRMYYYCLHSTGTAFRKRKTAMSPHNMIVISTPEIANYNRGLSVACGLDGAKSTPFSIWMNANY